LIFFFLFLISWVGRRLILLLSAFKCTSNLLRYLDLKRQFSQNYTSTIALSRGVVFHLGLLLVICILRTRFTAFTPFCAGLAAQPISRRRIHATGAMKMHDRKMKDRKTDELFWNYRHWRRQLWGTGARAPSTFNNFIFSLLWPNL